MQKKTLASLMLKIYRKVCIIHARTIRSSEQMHMSLTGIVSLENNFLFTRKQFFIHQSIVIYIQLENSRHFVLLSGFVQL